MNKVAKVTLATALSTLSFADAFAGPPRFLDARAFAMGGVGVTAARPAAASFYNPALLAVAQKEKANSFGMLLPSISLIARDEEELIDTVDDFEKDFIDPFDAAVNNFNPLDAPGTGSRAELATQASRVNEEMKRINGDQAIIDLGVGIAFQVPSEAVAFGFFASNSARVSGSLDFRDEALFEDIIANADTFGTPGDIPYDPSATDLQSTVRGVGSARAQVGASIASNFEIAGRQVAFGVSPKVVDFRAYDYSYDVDSFDDIDSDILTDTKVSESGFNVDLGLAGYLDQDEQWLAGLSIMNVLPMDVQTKDVLIPGTSFSPAFTVEGIKVEMKPIVTAGLSYQGESFVLASDIELTQTEALLNEDESQYFGLGAEYDLLDTFQLRAGLRQNLAGSSDTLYSTGFGFNVVGLTMELAAMIGSGGNSGGASFQFGASF